MEAMRLYFLAMVVTFFGFFGSISAQIAPLPVQPPLSRYEHIWKSTPFVAATEIAPQAQSIAQQYALSGYVQIGSSEAVFLFDRKTLTRFSISQEKGQNGVELLSVAATKDVKQLKARIRANGEVVDIAYDPSVATASGGTGGRASLPLSAPPGPAAGLTIPNVPTGPDAMRPIVIRRRALSPHGGIPQAGR